MYTLYKFHFLNGISEINQLFDDILIIWPAPVYTEQNYKCNTFVFAPIFHELNSKFQDFFYVHKRPISLKYCSRISLNLC